MSSKDKMTKSVSLRVSETTRKKFLKKASPYGGPAAVLRELVEAFIDGRLVLTTRNPNNSMEKLYDEYRK